MPRRGRVGCPDCGARAHPTCLASRFFRADADAAAAEGKIPVPPRRLIPPRGTCPSCDRELSWGAAVAAGRRPRGTETGAIGTAGTSGAGAEAAAGAGTGAGTGAGIGAGVGPGAGIARLARVDEATSSPRAESPVEWGMYDTEFELDDSDEGEKENDDDANVDDANVATDGKTNRRAVMISDSDSDSDSGEARSVPLAERLTKRRRREAAAAAARDRTRGEPPPAAVDVIRISTSP